ncbi:MAG: right-handed parallel beta-helix repeat-containing protein [Thermomicrobiales bacterium]
MFEAVVRSFSASGTRRALARMMGAGAALTLAVPELAPEALAKERHNDHHQDHLQKQRRRRRRKVRLCYQSQDIRKRRRRVKKWIRRGATRGRCQGCNPTCDNVSCGGSDGCGGTCGCATGAVCGDGTCLPCTVTCGGSAYDCGVSLITALLTGGDIAVCPGVYSGSFVYTRPSRVYGAGNGADPATSTILTEGNIGVGVVAVSAAGISSLANVRITGANATFGFGGGVLVHTPGADMTVSDCVITENSAMQGGGVAVLDGSITIAGCEITSNSTRNFGGGAYVQGTATITDTTISGNTSYQGGGIYNNYGITTLDATVFITGNSITQPTGGGIYNFSNLGTVIVGGATVTGNIPDNCAGVSCP